MTGTIRTIGRTLMLGATVLAMASACTGTKHRPITLPSASTTGTSGGSLSPTASPTPTLTPEQQVLNAYMGMMRAFDKAGLTSNPDDPDLPRYATGAALTLLQNGLRSMRDKGLLAKGETINHPKVESLTPPNAPRTARIRDCMDTRNDVAYKANGEPYHDTPGGFRLVIADAERIDGTWKITGMGVHEVGSCAL